MKKVLGKGLEALLGDVDFTIQNHSLKSNIVDISVNKIFTNHYQPRMFFEEKALQEMSAGVRLSINTAI